MNGFNPEQHRIETASALEILRSAENENVHATYVGLDVHKETIAVAVAEPGRGEPIYRGEIANNPKAVEKLLVKLSADYNGRLLLFCTKPAHAAMCSIGRSWPTATTARSLPPSRIPKVPGERIKSDRRDALKLARLLRGGDLTAVWVPDQEQERMRDLSRARDDMKAQERKARQQLNAFLLRHGYHWPRGKSRWSPAHENWLAGLKMEHPWPMGAKLGCRR